MPLKTRVTYLSNLHNGGTIMMNNGPSEMPNDVNYYVKCMTIKCTLSFRLYKNQLVLTNPVKFFSKINVTLIFRDP